MVKKFLFVLSICLFLTSCGSKTNQENENQKNEISISNNENSKKEISKNLSSKDDKNPYQNIYDLLKGKKLVFFTGSYSEGVYFYKDGYFDGALKTGDYNIVNQSIYNGKLDVVEKIDESTYKLKLVRFDYDIEVGDSIKKYINDEEITFNNVKAFTFDDDKSKYYILYLPDAKIENLDPDLVDYFRQEKKDMDNDKLGFIALKKDEPDSWPLSEFIKK